MKLLTGRNRQIIIVVSLVLTIAANAAAVLLPAAKLTTQQILDKVPVHFSPTGFIFTGWGIVYLGLIAFAIYQARKQAREAPWLDVVAVPFIVSSLANMAWFGLWQSQNTTLALIPLLILLLTLIYIYDKLEIGFYPVSRLSYWCVHFPFSIYLGFISVLTFINASVTLYNLGGGELFGFHGGSWAAGLCILAGALASVAMLRNRDYAYTLVIALALVGVGVKFWDQQIQVLLFGIALAFGVMLISAGFSILKSTEEKPASNAKLMSLNLSKPL
jgi:translocator protein